MLVLFLPLLALALFLPVPPLFAFQTQYPSSSRTALIARPMARGYSAEVVGASGRMGTFWLDHHGFGSGERGGGINSPSEASTISCPRGTAPGSQTPEGCPIYVATPSDAYLPIYEATPPSRRKDLVLVGNAGLPIDDRFRDCTILVPHFSVLYQNQWNDDETTSDKKSEPNNNNKTKEDLTAGNRSSRRIQVNTDPLVSPPTYIYGKHGATVATVLEANGIATELVPSFREIRGYSGRKLLWASCFWLLCHSGDGDDNCVLDGEDGHSLPLTVGKVHEVRQVDLEKLVDEILPSLRDFLLVVDDHGGGGIEDESKTPTEIENIIDRASVLDYLKAYSESISGAVPSVDLAKQEFPDRNGVWLLPNPRKEGLRNHHDEQPFHTELLRKQGLDVGAATIPEDR